MGGCERAASQHLSPKKVRADDEGGGDTLLDEGTTAQTGPRR